MGTQNFGTTHIVRIFEDWSSLLQQRPEIDVKFQNGAITDVVLPKEAQNTTLVILSGNVAHLEYFFNGEHIKYTSADAHKSKIYELLEEYNRKLAEKNM